jgi:cobalt-zinc-cadmium efflux system outer membrane protein
MITFRTSLVTALLALAPIGCVLRPDGTAEQRQLLQERGQRYAAPAGERRVPELPGQPTWRDILQRAFLANAELEAAYHDWAAAYHRIDQAATWPNQDVEIGMSYAFSSERMKSWDRTTISGTFSDPVMLPGKITARAKVALADAQAAAERFRAKKFEIQQKVLTQWLDYALTAEKLRIARDNVELLRLLSESAETRVRAGGLQQDLLKAQIEHRLAENELRDLEAELPQMRAGLNALLGRAADAPLEPPRTLPEPRVMTVDDATLIVALAERNAELAGLSRAVQGRRDALELSRMQWYPDINVEAAFTGSIMQEVGAMVMLPTRIPAIRAAIRESEASLRSAEAMRVQAQRDRGASAVAALVALRNAERQTKLLSDTILPAARQLLDSVRQSYSAGTASFLDLIEAQRTLLEVRQMLSVAAISREKRLAEVETLAGIDLETLEDNAP